MGDVSFLIPSTFAGCLRRAVRWSYGSVYRAPAADPIARDSRRAAIRAAVALAFPTPPAVKRNGGLRGSTATRRKRL